MSRQKDDGMLNPYRVLDLTDEKGPLCGKLLGDLGADVIKIERPEGDSARSLGPFYHDEAEPEKSLFWFAYNTSKRGITLDIETADGQEIFKSLVKSADFIIESFSPGYMDSLDLGYQALEKINAGIILVSITPFGQSGPYRDYKISDIVAWAMGGRMYPTGHPDDRPPVRISHHYQTYLHGGAEAAVAAMLALYHREATGEGQHVDVSIHASVSQLMQDTADWDTIGTVPKRESPPTVNLISLKRMWPCKDGHVIWLLWGGTHGSMFWPPLLKWMESEGAADDFLLGFDWENFSAETATKETIDRIVGQTARFFMSHTKAELMERAAKDHIMLGPVYNTADVLQNIQLAARGFWAEVEHPELGTSIPYPGAFAHCSEASPKITGRAPLIGEHNREIYENELGISKGEILTLKQAKVI